MERLEEEQDDAPNCHDSKHDQKREPRRDGEEPPVEQEDRELHEGDVDNVDNLSNVEGFEERPKLRMVDIGDVAAGCWSET